MGRVNPQEQSGVREVLGPHGEKQSHSWKDIWWRLLKPPGPSRPQKAATFAGAGNKLVKGEAWCQVRVVISHHP